MKKIIVTAILSALAGVGAQGQSFSAKPVDYGRLSVDNMPPIQIIVKKASKASTSGPLDVNAEIRKVRSSNLLPRFRALTGATSLPNYQYGYTQLENEFNYYPANDPGSLHSSTYQELNNTYVNKGPSSRFYSQAYLQARWELNKVVFDREEIYVRETKARTSYYKKGTLDNVVKVYSELMELLSEKVPGDDDPYLERDIVAAAAELDFLTGYFLTDIIKELKEEPLIKTAPPAEAKPDVSVSSVKKEMRDEKNQKEAEVDPQLDPSSPLYELGDALPDAPLDDIEVDISE